MPITKTVGVSGFSGWSIGWLSSWSKDVKSTQGSAHNSRFIPACGEGILWQVVDPCFALQLKVYFPVENFPVCIRYLNIDSSKG